MTGSEIWTKTNEEGLSVWVRKIIRKVFEPATHDATGRYMIRINHALEEQRQH